MPDQGSIGQSAGSVYDPRIDLGIPNYPRVYTGMRILGCVEPNNERLFNGGRLDTDGNPLPPCLNILNGGRMRFVLPVAIGTRNVAVKVREVSDFISAGRRPKLRVLANSAMGIPTTLEAQAPVGSGWFTLGPLTFTAPAAGAIVVELESFNDNNEQSDCRWDSVQIT